ncbi:hypothetical protein YTPLAS18_24150 [Nitrospira sp.]|nr:hypothetical protein YTPLAS18_24150 [Nitrospira sp.]
MSLLVTDGNERAALAVTRALGREGIEVIVGSEQDRPLAGASRHCAGVIRYPSPYVDPGGYIQALLDTVNERHVRVLLPLSDIAMSLIGAARTRFAGVTAVPVPALEVYEAVSDKYGLMQMAQSLGVPIPETVFVPDGIVPASAHAPGGFPVIVKPGRSRVCLEGRWEKTAVQVVGSQEELHALYKTTPYLRLPSLIQRRVEGEGQGVFALFDHGKPVTLFAHRRLREKPPSGGVSVLRESIEVPPIMAVHAVRLLEKVGWHGVAMVEFKVEPSTGIPRLMEINGRFWGSLQLAIDAGVNFPWLLYRLALGQPIDSRPAAYRAGVKSRWVVGDVDHLLARIFKSDRALNLPPGYPSRWQCARDFLRFLEPDLYCEVERWDDLGPARVEWSKYLKSLIGVAA